jgi:hypothetical protein
MNAWGNEAIPEILMSIVQINLNADEKINTI